MNMLDTYAYKFYYIGAYIKYIRALVPFQPIATRRQLPNEIKLDINNNLVVILSHCEEINLTSLAKYIRRVLALPLNQYTFNTIFRIFEELEGRFQDDLPSVVFKHVLTERVILYKHPHLFGLDVAKQFPSASYDIQQAGSCLALDCHTACVMHLMRALEVALDALGLGVGVPNSVIEAKNSWETLLRKTSDQIDKNNKSGDPTWPSKRSFFTEAQAHLFAVKNAWRNPSMHLEKKYDEKEAGRIFRAVKDFMEPLATHLDESGQFTP